MVIDQSKLLKEPSEFASVPQIQPLSMPQPAVEYVTMSRMAPGLKPMQWSFIAPGPVIPMGSGLEPSTTHSEENELKDLKPPLNKKTCREKHNIKREEMS
jgi:hypothetical protein